MGRLQLAEPLTACDYIRTKDDSIVEPILVATRGDCPFFKKALYAQYAGAKMLIIVDNQYEEVESKLMIDLSGQGENIHIPSVLLAKQGGDKLIESLRSNRPEVSNINIVFEFALPRTDKIEYHAWLSSSTAQTFRFLREWRPYERGLNPDATLVPHFVHFKVPPGQMMEGDAANCMCGGKYCSTDPDLDLPNNGRDVLYEDLRQMCIISEYGIDAWWSYIQAYEEACLQGHDMKACSEDVLNGLRMGSTDIDFCVKRSFDNPDPNKCTYNRFLDAEALAMEKDGVLIFPSVFINGFAYRGNLIPGEGLFEALCESFNKFPAFCEGKFDTTNNVSPINHRHFPVFGAALIFLIVFSVFVCICYRRHLKREMYKQMIRDVNIAVSQYIAFKDEDERGDQEYATQAETK